MSVKSSLIATAIILSNFTAAYAHDFTIGDIVLKHPQMRFTIPNAKATGGYITIQNNGDIDDRLVGATAKIAKKVEVHNMIMDGDIMKMRKVAGGLEIPAGETIELKPGGFHLMFMGLNQPLTLGDFEYAELEFEKSGKVKVTFQIEKVSGHSMSEMKDNK